MRPPQMINENLKNLLISVDELHLWEQNPRKGSIEAIKASIERFGFQTPVVYKTDPQGFKTVYAGNHRLQAAIALGLSEIPAIAADDLTAEEIQAFAMADNRTSDLAEYDKEAMAELIAELNQQHDDLLKDMQFDDAEIDQIISGMPYETIQETQPVPEPKADPITKLGDVWKLGQHRLICGDCTHTETLNKLMDGNKASLLHADPPYGMNKKGIENDNLHGSNLDAFQMEWFNTCNQHVNDNGSVYIWGNPEDLWRLWFVGGLKETKNLNFRTEVVWNKISGGQGIGAEATRCFFPTGERCLFLMKGPQQQSTNSENYWEGWEPIRTYLDSEREKAGMTKADIHKITGTQMASHWFAKSQWSLPTKEHYQAFQNAANGKAFKREYDDIKREYDDIKREYDQIHQEWLSNRAYFDNTHDNMTDVWEFQRVTGEDRHGHETPKPVEMMERILKTSTQPNNIVLAPFAGTLPEIIAAQNLGRKCYAAELDPAYCDVICERFENATGIEAKLVENIND